MVGVDVGVGVAMDVGVGVALGSNPPVAAIVAITAMAITTVISNAGIAFLMHHLLVNPLHINKTLPFASTLSRR